MTQTLWVLGAPDPEMEMIERYLRLAGARIAYATCDGGRVHPGNAYRAECQEADLLRAGGGQIYLVEAAPAKHSLLQYREGAANVDRIDHHRPGDPGYRRPAAEFLGASSIGQVVAELAGRGELPGWECARIPFLETGGKTRRFVLGGAEDSHPQKWMVRLSHGAVVVPDEIVLCAAADHCLGAAYAGLCPGIDPDTFMAWRIRQRAKFQGRAERDILADIQRAQAHISGSPKIIVGDYAAYDLRQPDPIPELPDAAARMGISYISGPLQTPDGVEKFTCSSPKPEILAAFMAEWAPANGLTNIYGDPVRGFAGGSRRP